MTEAEIKFLTLPTSMGAVTLELHWDPKLRVFEKQDGHLWHRFDDSEMAELAARGGVTEAVLRERLEAELDLDVRLG